jgi:hypothetical protein
VARLLSRQIRWIALAAALGACGAGALLAASPPRPRDSARLASFPQTILWAWERPEDLRFVDPREVGIAYLACTIGLRGDGVAVRPRLQPISYPPEAVRIAVFRVETDRERRPSLSVGQRRAVVAAVLDRARDAGVAGVQIDFDAALSQRAFYRDLLVDLRDGLPASTPLSMTALASWAVHDRWLEGLPVDEVVPMLFRMGADGKRVRAYLDAGEDFAEPLCRTSVGFSTDEPRAKVPPGRRVYLFSPTSWTRAALDAAAGEHER